FIFFLLQVLRTTLFSYFCETNKVKIMRFIFYRFLLVLVFGISFLSYAQDNPQSDFDKHEAFSPLFLNEMANSYHSATGEPGPDYWQNIADYKIKATLDTINHRITGKMTL